MEQRQIGSGPSATILGFGCMRMPSDVNEQGESTLRMDEAIELIRHAIDSGITYIDTAYPYHNEMSEVAVGRALQDGYRERVILATKSPIWKLERTEDFSSILSEQLEKLQTDHIDLYLLHALGKERWQTVLDLNILDEMLKEKAAGRIRQLGFSFHDDKDTFYQILNGFSDWDFCQLQMNYINTDFQSTLQGLYDAHAKGLGIIIMEPLLGGKLADPPEVVSAMIPGDPVEYAFRWLWDKPEVSVVLSGMNDKAQVDHNVALANQTFEELTPAELAHYEAVKAVYDTMALVPCTRCNYCMPCPYGVHIPGAFEAYNITASKNKSAGRRLYDGLDLDASGCVGCRACEEVCPQAIPVATHMPVIEEYFSK
ncbi:MAG TPA: aldo/keto reductase [Tissierellia bacterium]|nr:aldo/keto reductase [Tissierellia bacterium]